MTAKQIAGYLKAVKAPDGSERDTAMTAASDADIAWVRPGRTSSGTAANLARRYFKKR